MKHLLPVVLLPGNIFNVQSMSAVQLNMRLFIESPRPSKALKIKMLIMLSDDNDWLTTGAHAANRMQHFTSPRKNR